MTVKHQIQREQDFKWNSQEPALTQMGLRNFIKYHTCTKGEIWWDYNKV